jgi:virginiamycin A acetyltransferase
LPPEEFEAIVPDEQKKQRFGQITLKYMPARGAIMSERTCPANQNKSTLLNKTEGKKLPILGGLLFWLYRIPRGSLRRLISDILLRFEGKYLSITIRRILSTYHKVEIGMYSNVIAATRDAYPPGTKIGRYCAINRTIRVFGASHPMNTRSTHAIFYNPAVGYVKQDFLKRTAPVIGNDVFIGYNAIILNNVKSIGDGAYIAAGAIVTKDVPPYALVAGNPARIIRYRFSQEIIDELLQERWWEKSLDELMLDLKKFQIPLEGEEIR